MTILQFNSMHTQWHFWLQVLRLCPYITGSLPILPNIEDTSMILFVATWNFPRCTYGKLIEIHWEKLTVLWPSHLENKSVIPLERLSNVVPKFCVALPNYFCHKWSWAFCSTIKAFQGLNWAIWIKEWFELISSNTTMSVDLLVLQEWPTFLKMIIFIP